MDSDMDPTQENLSRKYVDLFRMASDPGIITRVFTVEPNTTFNYGFHRLSSIQSP